MESLRLARARLAVLDFETTGVSRGDHRIVELGLVVVDRLEITEQFGTFLNPSLPINAAATEQHGIVDADVANAPRFLELAADLRGRLAGVDALVFHNAPFDMAFLQRELKGCGLPLLDRPVVDTLSAARVAWGRGENSLAEVAGRLGVKTRVVHRALPDALTTARVLIEFAGYFGEQFPLAGFPGFCADGSIYYRSDVHRVRRTARLMAAALAGAADLPVAGAGFVAEAGGPRDPAGPIDPALLFARQAAEMAYAAAPARPNVTEDTGQNQTVLRILLNSAVRSRREVTVLLAVAAPPAAPGAATAAAADPRPRTLARRVEPRRVEDVALVAWCPVRGAEEHFPFAQIVEVRW